jgi:hypothetical protein
VENAGTADTYTLLDTLDFTTTGVQFLSNALVTTAGGLINPGLAGGAFTPANGVTVQISDTDTALPQGVTHTYLVALSLAVDGNTLDDGQCTGMPGAGLFNSAALAGSPGSASETCASLVGGRPAIELVKTVELSVDFNANGFGDVGDVLGYSFSIRNAGNQPLSLVHLLDERVSDLECDPETMNSQPLDVLRNAEIFNNSFFGVGTLAPDDSILCWATHELTADDLAQRRVVNTATASGRGLSDETVQSTSTAIFGAFQ